MRSSMLFSILILSLLSQGVAQTPDLIYYSGNIITMEDSQPRAEAIAIAGDSIMAVGTNTDVLALAGVETQLIDLQGSTVLPGFNDSHCHWFSWREHRCELRGEVTYPSLEEIMTMLSANGWTSISELNFGRPDVAPEHLNNALDLARRGKLSVRLNGYWGTLEYEGDLIDVLADSNRTPDRIYADRVHAPGVKIYVDNPFGDFDLWTQEEVTRLVQKAAARGWQIAAHAVNESAVEKILTAYETVLGSQTNETHRYRIEHAVKVSDDQLERIKQKGIILSFQLLGPADWPTQTTFASRFLGSHPEWVMRWKDFVAAVPDGAYTTGSTDAPFNEAPCDYSPFTIIYQAVTRKGYIDRILASWEEAQRLTVEQSLRLLTIDGAYATFEENQKGSLTPGKWADLVIVSDNPLDVATPEDLLNIDILLTMVGGEVEYCNDISPFCAPAETFSIHGAVLTASRYLSDQTPDRAYDGDLETSWGAGEGAPQWLQIDLTETVEITGLDLVVDQWPEGTTRHQIWAKQALTDTFTLIHEFHEHTTFGQTLSWNAPPDLPAYRYFRILTTESPSWVAWKEIVFHRKDATSVAEGRTGVPQTFALLPNYPNPFNPETRIRYDLPVQAEVKLTVYNVLGNTVRTLVARKQSAGTHFVVWDGRDDRGRELSSGLYLYRLQAGEFRKTSKMLLLK